MYNQISPFIILFQFFLRAIAFRDFLFKIKELTPRSVLYVCGGGGCGGVCVCVCVVCLFVFVKRFLKQLFIFFCECDL